MFRQFDVEIKALRGVFNQDEILAPITERQLIGLNSLISSGLSDTANRIPVLKVITGLEKLTSSKQLTLHTASVLITEIKDAEGWTLNEYGQWLVLEAEKRVEEHARQSKGGVDPLRNAPTLFDMW